MTATNKDTLAHLLISSADLSHYLGLSRPKAHDLMRRLSIPKRGKGFLKARLLAAFGFPPQIAMDDPEIWQPLLDVPAAAKAAHLSPKTMGRMFAGDHADQTFINCLHIGPRKRLIFPFELRAWLFDEPPQFIRERHLMHKSLRKDYSPQKPAAAAPTPAPASGKEQQSPVTHLFMPPK